MPSVQADRSIAVATPLGEEALLFRSMKGSEQLSKMFQYDLELSSADENINFDDILGKNVTVRLDVGEDAQRFFNGFVSRFSQTGRTADYAIYSATLRPWLWFLTRTADCRIFQEMTVPEIIKSIFEEHGFSDFKESLSGSYRKWVYCVQYRETDLNFISRLMEQEGIYYFFKHEDGKHTLIMADAYSAHEPIPGYEQIPYYPPTENVVREEDHISDWFCGREIQPGLYALTDFDFEKPKSDLAVKASIPRTHELADFEIYDYPGEYIEVGDGDVYAKARIEELHVQFEQTRGRGNARGIASGGLFELTGHPRDDQNREYLVVSASHELRSEEFASGASSGGPTYLCRFTAIESKQPYRAPRLTPKPVVQGPQTAVVVGKSGEEIWTDEHGRVKVQFHWDREGQVDENSSCWIRVAQVWAGKNWGGIEIPRMGQEVIVDFLEGDPDRPIITGRVYNGDNKPPYALPDDQTMSGIKSNSSKGGEGFNELRFEDKKDEEQIFLHAQKNLDIRVLNDRFETIDNDRHLVVENDKKEHVKNDRHEEIGNHHQEKIGGDRNLKVVGKQAAEVEGSLSLTVGDDVLEKFKKNHSEEVTNDYYVKADNIVIEASTNITVKVGQSSIAIESSGIKIATSGELVLDAKSTVGIKGAAGLTLESPAQAELKSANTTVKGDAMTTIQGGLVKIN